MKYDRNPEHTKTAYSKNGLKTKITGFYQDTHFQLIPTNRPENKKLLSYCRQCLDPCKLSLHNKLENRSFHPDFALDLNGLNCRELFHCWLENWFHPNEPL